jgi:S1-C subfamily serine protease
VGFSAEGGESLFGDGESSAELKVGVLIDDLKGRFCADCPSLLNRSGIPASVVMTANWEVYSALERRVVARLTTSGGADYKTPLQGSILPAIYAGFRENVRLLLTNEEFRKLVTQTREDRTNKATASATPMLLTAGPAHLGIGQATSAVVIVFAVDGSGSGFLVSSDGYLLTNHHVVGASKFVKLRWTDGSESLGEVVRSDSLRDVALVKTDARGRSALDLRLGAVRQGEPVYAIGTPLDDALQNTMTRGIVSAMRMEGDMPYIQSDVAVTHGNSGGPLLDEKGQVIGMTVSGRALNGLPIGLNFFIPIEDALRALALTPAAPAPRETVAAAPTRAHAARKP